MLRRFGFFAYQFISIVGLLMVLVLFTACGRSGFVAEKGLSTDFASQGVCESQLKQIYEQTYFPHLSARCNNCHSNGHGSRNLSTSFSNFLAKGESLIEYKATHPHGDNGVNLTAEIAEFKPEWSVGQEEYLICLASNSGSGEGRLRVDAKPVPDISQTIRTNATTGLTENSTGNNAWKSIEWDIEAEVPMAARGEFKAFLKAEARFAVQSGQVIGFEIRNPSMRLKSVGAGDRNLEVNGLNLFLDNQFQFNVTTFTSVSKVVAATTDVPLAPGSAYAMAWFPEARNNTAVSFEISNIIHTSATGDGGTGGPGGPGNGAQVRYNDLISTDPQLGIFRNVCFACHNQGANSPAGLDLANYNTARGRITQILERINSNDPNFRMPRGGQPLSQAQKDVIANWANGGTPQ